MKSLKVLFITVLLTCSNNLWSQQQLVTIEMHGYNEIWPSSTGFGVSTFTTSQFIVQTTDHAGEVTKTLYGPSNLRNPIETLPCLRKEIDVWLAKGFKMFSFNVTATGEDNTTFRYLVLLVKDE